MEKKYFIVLLFLFIFSPVYSQFSDDIESSEVFAPFVSRLKATLNEATIILTWNDSSDVSGQNYIYRHNEEITADNFDNADLIGIVDSGAGTFVDKPPTTNPYYYAVLIQDDDQLYKVFIPFRNKTIISIKIPDISKPEIASADITDINAVSNEDHIIITFNSSTEDRELLMYRNDSPITTYSDLFDAISWVLPSNTLEYKDTPPAGIGYYYAVLDSELVKIGNISLVLDENTTKYAVKLPITEENRILSVEVPEQMRSRPLPYLMLQTDISTGEMLETPPLDLPEKQELTPAASKAIAELISQYTPPAREDITVQLLEVDKADNYTGEEFILNNIVKNELLTHKYLTAISSLIDYISVHRPKNLETRARFYLAQGYYFSKQYDKAILEFLMAKEEYLPESTAWIDACLLKLMENNS
jgi:hypothetical protein